MGKAQERVLQLEREIYRTDENHPLTEREFQERIDAAIRCGFVDRRTIYSDVDVLQPFCGDAIKYSARAGGYYMEHDVTPLDCLMLAERVGQYPVLGEAEIRRINDLIESRLYPDALSLVTGGIVVRYDRMAPRGDVCYTMRILISAMAERKRVCFQYEIFDLRFSLMPKHGGRWYDVSCYRFQFDDNTVYVYAGDAAAQQKKTFRIERMVRVFVSEETMEPAEKYYGSRSEEELRRQVNESAFHFDGEQVRLVLAVKYEPFIMEILWNLSRGTARTVEEIDEETIRVEFVTRKSDPLVRMLASYGDLIRVESPREVAEDIRNLLHLAKRTYGV